MEPWEIMISESGADGCVVRPQMLDAVVRLRALGASRHHDRRGDRDRRPAGAARRRDRRLDPRAASPTSAPATRSSSASPTRGRRPCRPHQAQRRERCRQDGCSSSTTSSPAPCAVRASTPPCFVSGLRCAVARIGPWPGEPRPVRSGRAGGAGAARNVACPAASRSGSPTASTSAIPRNRRSPMSSPRRSRASPGGRALGIRRPGNVSPTTRPTAC